MQRLVAAHQRGERLVLVFDYDGTLTPFATRPELARLDPGLRCVLARLAATARVAVGVVSGRTLDDLTAMVDLTGLYYGGTYGLELDLRGERIAPPETPASALIRDLIAALEIHLPGYPGAWIEKKPLGLTLHYREVATARIESLRTVTLAALEPHCAALQVFDGPLAIEVCLALGVDKGTALRAIVAHASPAQPALVLYAGDAANDAAALTAAVELNGMAVGIGPQPPTAAVQRLPDPAALGHLLAELDRALTRNRPSA